MFSNTTTKTSKGQTIVHKNILLKRRNNPLEQSSRSSLPADRTDSRTDCLTERTTRSIEPTVRSPGCSTQHHLFPFYALLIVMLSKLFRLTLLSSAPFNPSINRCEYTRTLFALALLGVTYVTYLNHNRTHYSIILNANRYACIT
ncbi:hypothetical protein HanIR_Chr06g0287101 [Helianthus annuus]|nr:hypothetical protein HanIR_Chr06g0287101 [Helianthus annuus]